jgi:hypothetical protein
LDEFHSQAREINRVIQQLSVLLPYIIEYIIIDITYILLFLR